MASSGGAAASGSSNNPRKFSEKIALHRQKEAEEKAEFEKMMKELNAVKGQVQSSSQQQQQQQHLARQTMGMGSAHSAQQHGSSGGGVIRHPHSPNRHLSPPNFSSSVGPRHGSLPNVNAAMGMQLPGGIQSVLSSEDFPLVITSGGGGHVSVRDGSGPMRSSKSRIDTSPYGSERYAAGGGYHLSPPDPSWRRVHSDSSIHHSVGNNGGGGGNPVLSQNGTVSPLHGASPTTIRRAPNSHHHVQMSNNSGDAQGMDQHLSSSYRCSFLDLPHNSKDQSGGGGGADHNAKPGSLPDLTNFHVNNPAVSNCSQTLDYEEQSSLYSSPQQQQHPPSSSSNAPSMSSNVSHLCSSSVETTASAQHYTSCSPSSTPTSVSYSRLVYDDTQKGSVRLSDDQISEILSIPMALVTGGCDLVAGNCDHHLPTSPNSSSSSSNKLRFCDTSSSTTTVQNWLHANKGMTIDQGGSVTSGGMYIYNQMSNGQTSPTSESPQSISTYRNPQMIPTAQSPLGYMQQGSPSGRSASPNEMLGSPNSPNPPSSAHCPSPNHCSPGVYDSMTGGGGSYGAAQNELSNEFQKFTMVENADGSMFFQDAGGNYNSQPMSDLVNFLGNSHSDLKNNHQGGGNGYHMAPQTPQTPSSIPDIILTDADDASEQAYQRAFAMTFDGPNSVVDCLSQEISANFSDLGKLDDSMLRLLAEGVTMDQQIADPMTEEHLKL